MKSKQITEAEWAVMEVLWNKSPQTSLEITTKLQQEQDTHQTSATIKTLLARLVKKSSLSYEKIGNRYLYSPTLTREEAVTTEMNSFLSRVTKGSLFPLIAHSMQSKDTLKSSELEELRQLLSEQESLSENQSSQQ